MQKVFWGVGGGSLFICLFLFCFLETGFLELRVPPVFAFHAGIKGIHHMHLFVKLIHINLNS